MDRRGNEYRATQQSARAAGYSGFSFVVLARDDTPRYGGWVGGDGAIYLYAVSGLE